jgi:ligand-binding sensor protein
MTTSTNFGVSCNIIKQNEKPKSKHQKSKAMGREIKHKTQNI